MKYSKKFYCKERKNTLEYPHVAAAGPAHGNSQTNHLLLMGDSVMIQYADALSCLLPEFSFEFRYAAGLSAPICQAVQSSALNSSTVLILNSGLWYNRDKIKYYYSELSCLRKVLTAAKKQYPGMRVFWLQTVAQHFATRSGAYAKKATASCMRYSKFAKARRLNFRWKAVESHLLGEDSPVTIVPVWEATAPFYFEHPGYYGSSLDCSHYCSNYKGIPYYVAQFISSFSAT